MNTRTIHPTPQLRRSLEIAQRDQLKATRTAEGYRVASRSDPTHPHNLGRSESGEIMPCDCIQYQLKGMCAHYAAASLAEAAFSGAVIAGFEGNLTPARVVDETVASFIPRRGQVYRTAR